MLRLSLKIFLFFFPPNSTCVCGLRSADNFSSLKLDNQAGRCLIIDVAECLECVFLSHGLYHVYQFFVFNVAVPAAPLHIPGTRSSPLAAPSSLATSRHAAPRPLRHARLASPVIPGLTGNLPAVPESVPELVEGPVEGRPCRHARPRPCISCHTEHHLRSYRAKRVYLCHGLVCPVVLSNGPPGTVGGRRFPIKSGMTGAPFDRPFDKLRDHSGTDSGPAVNDGI